MVYIDLLGLLFTIVFIGLRYPVCVLAASLLHAAGPVAVTAFFHGRLDSLMAAGVFSTTAVSHLPSGMSQIVIGFSAPAVNYIAAILTGGIDYDRTADLINPWSTLKKPFAVINWRLAILSALGEIWRICIS